MPETTAEKSYDPTPRRRQEARKEGHVATSQDLASAVLLIAGVLLIMTAGRGIMEMVAGMMHRALGGSAWLTVDSTFVVQHWKATMSQLARDLLPLLGTLMAAGVLVSLLQVGFLYVPQRVMPDISRIDPLKGLGRLFSLTSAMRLMFGLFKVAVICVVAYASLHATWGQLLSVSQAEVPQIADFMVDTILGICLNVGIALVVLAILDYAYQRWKHESDLRMTHQEMRDELKNYQGDPQIVARRRAAQRQLVLNRLADAVPKADVVVTNPTELSVAIRYDPNEMSAPLVVAKGAGVLAQRIRRLALEHDVPIVEKKPLAQALYKDVEVNQPIPDKMYAAVAEVLAYVYQLKGHHLPGMRPAA